MSFDGKPFIGALVTIDISDPNTPSLVDSTTAGMIGYGIDVAGDVAFASGQS